MRKQSWNYKKWEEQNKTGIIDQVPAHPIRYTFMLTWDIFDLNKLLFFMVMVTVIIFSLITNLPIVGLIASMFIGLSIFSLSFFVGKTFYYAKTMGQLIAVIRTTMIENLWEDYWKPSLGAYMGWVVLMLAITLLTNFIININDQESNLATAMLTGDPVVIRAIIPYMTLPFILIMLFLYVMPLVFVNVIKTDNFNDAFKAVFTVFSKDVWRRALTGAYFKYMSLLGLLIIFATAIVAVVSELIMALFGALGPLMVPVGMEFVLLLTVVFQIALNVFYAVSSVIAERITQQQ